MGDEDDAVLSGTGRPAERSAADTVASTARPSDFYPLGDPIGDELREQEAAEDAAHDPWAPRGQGPTHTPTEAELRETLEDIGNDVLDVLRDVDEAVPGLLRPTPRPLVSEAPPDALEDLGFVSTAPVVDEAPDDTFVAALEDEPSTNDFDDSPDFDQL